LNAVIENALPQPIQTQWLERRTLDAAEVPTGVLDSLELAEEVLLIEDDRELVLQDM
jgi:hypothetical protein